MFGLSRFHHLVGYGATYYAYLYAQALSAAIWQQQFANRPLTRAAGAPHCTPEHLRLDQRRRISQVERMLWMHAGDHIRRTMLQVGSAKEPLTYVTGILGPGHLEAVNGGYKPQINSLLRELGAGL